MYAVKTLCLSISPMIQEHNGKDGWKKF